MTWKKLLAGSAGMALLAAWGVSLSNCTVCSGPQCFNNTEGGSTDTGTGSDTATGDSGNTDGGGGTCSAIKPGGPIFWDNSMGTGTCDKCMAANCCSAAQACVADKDGGADSCFSYVQCFDVCSDQTCVDACGDPDGGDSPNGKKTYDNVVLGCMNSKCMTACQ